MDLSYLQVMGILMLPRFFYAGKPETDRNGNCRTYTSNRVPKGSIIDVGAYSSRPNAEHIKVRTEKCPVCHGLRLYSANVPILFR